MTAKQLARGSNPAAATPFIGRPSHRRRVRLDAECYSEIGRICSVTIAVRARQPVFADFEVATAAVDVLSGLSSREQVPVYAYCVMPDHIHLLIGPSAGCDVITFVGRFKNLTQREAWRLEVSGRFWQESFWDHFLRAEQSVEQVADYILNNPVRAGLVQTWREYPFSGSLVGEL